MHHNIHIFIYKNILKREYFFQLQNNKFKRKEIDMEYDEDEYESQYADQLEALRDMEGGKQI